MSIQKSLSLNEKVSESTRILAKFPDKIPVIIETEDEDIKKNLRKNKFLVPYDVSASYLLVVVRRQIKISSSTALFMFCNNLLLTSNEMMGKVYEDYKIKNNIGPNSDKFLYIKISKENTFG